MAGPLPSGESGLFPLLTGRLQNRGGRAEELKGSKALGHFCEQSDLRTLIGRMMSLVELSACFSSSVARKQKISVFTQAVAAEN